MSRQAKVEMVFQLDLDRPEQAAQAAREVAAAATAEQWEAMALWASAVLEAAEPGLVLAVARAVKERHLVAHG